MKIANIKISNLLSYPYQPDFSKIEGIKFYNRPNNNVNVLIWPNGAGKSWFLHIIKQIMRVGLMNDYIYHKKHISDSTAMNQTIVLHEQQLEWLHPHFRTSDKESKVLIQVVLTEYDYDNMHYIADHANIFNSLIKQYSSLNIQYPEFPLDQIQHIPSTLTLEFSFDLQKGLIVLNEQQFSPEEQFVVLYLKNIELLQICIDIYNEFVGIGKENTLQPLKNWIAFIGTRRTLTNIPHAVDPHTRNELIGDKDCSWHHASLWFYLCVKKIWNVISDHWNLKMTTKNIANYPERLASSDFYTSLSFIIKKYFNRILHVEFKNDMLYFFLVDVFGNILSFSELSDGEQSLLSIIFTLYGYDLKDGMVIIDEPEIHFHPQMQRSFSRMVEKINQNIGTQFIISTYSPLLINESNIANVYRFSKIDGETHIKNPFFTLSSDEASLVHLLKFENLSKIFFVNNIIMVEWETDAYFFDFYLRYLHTLPEWKNIVRDYEIININGKWSYKIWSKFLDRFGLHTYFIGDWDNIVDYGFMTQSDLSSYYKQTRSYYAWLKKSGKTHRHYNKLVDTIRNMFPQKYKQLIASIDGMYPKNIFILKKWDIETYLGMPEKGLENTVNFCHKNFKNWMANKNFDACRQEFWEIFTKIFSSKI